MGGAATFIGMAISSITVILGILLLGGDLNNFADLASVMLTIIPTFGALMATYPMDTLARIPASIKALLSKPFVPEEYIDIIYEMAKKARSEGLLSIEQEAASFTDPFLKYGVRLVVDGADDVYVKNALCSYLAGMELRHSEMVALYEKGAAYAPAFGMCATVVSLINMLMGLDFSDPNAINSLGGNMSAALITTFYGSLVANIIFLPIAGRLKALHKQEVFCKSLIGDGLLSLQHGDNPTRLRETLMQQVRVKGAKGAEPAEAGGSSE